MKEFCLVLKFLYKSLNSINPIEIEVPALLANPAIAGFDIANVEQLPGYALPDLESGSPIGGFGIRFYTKQYYQPTSKALQDCKSCDSGVRHCKCRTAVRLRSS
jgi:hypothetical protein